MVQPQASDDVVDRWGGVITDKFRPGVGNLEVKMKWKVYNLFCFAPAFQCGRAQSKAGVVIV